MTTVLVVGMIAVAATALTLSHDESMATDVPETVDVSTSAEATTEATTPPSIMVAPSTAPSIAIEPPRPRGDLGLSQVMTVPECDGTGVVILRSATDPSTYQSEIATVLARYPDAAYLRTDNACPSLRQQTGSGSAIYAVYRPAGSSVANVCQAVRDAGGDSYGKWLDMVTDSSFIIPC